jgi:hypothetical protein
VGYLVTAVIYEQAHPRGDHTVSRFRSIPLTTALVALGAGLSQGLSTAAGYATGPELRMLAITTVLVAASAVAAAPDLLKKRL